MQPTYLDFCAWQRWLQLLFLATFSSKLLKLSEFPHGAVHPTYHSQNFWSPYQFLCKQRIYLDTVLLLKTENWKYCNKIIFKYVDSVIGPSFKVRFTFFRTYIGSMNSAQDSAKNANALLSKPSQNDNQEFIINLNKFNYNHKTQSKRTENYKRKSY